MKRRLQQYFNISEKQAGGTVALVIVAIFLAFVPFAYNYYKIQTYKPVSYANEIAALQDFQTRPQRSDTNFHTQRYTYDYESPKGKKPQYARLDRTEHAPQLFYFDPNTVDDEGLRKLGLSEYSINSFNNYRKTGAKVYNADGIRRIYGLSPQLAEKIIPYATIKQPERQTNYETRQPYARPEIKSIDINAADTLQWQSLPGIGPGYARRIVNFRDKLGGFHTVAQVAETYGLPDSTFKAIQKYLQNDKGFTKPLNINTDDYQSLKHPYLSFAQARAITNYRKQHGNYTSVEQLMNVMVIDEKTFERIAPYVTLQ